jgi:hypothetical protein
MRAGRAAGRLPSGPWIEKRVVTTIVEIRSPFLDGLIGTGRSPTAPSAARPWPGLDDARMRLDPARNTRENNRMEVQGRIHNGVVVLEGELPLPEGTTVTVSYHGAPPEKSPETHRPVQLPLVRSDRPGSRLLTADRLAELLEDEDVSA